MALEIRYVAYGRAASEGLRDAIASAQRDDLLAPVTVVVPRNAVGVAMRRLLASGDLDPAPGRSGAGLANVSFTTLRRLAMTLGAPALSRSGRVPLSETLLHASIRVVLADDPGPFAPVRTHPSTVTALAELWHELRGATSHARGRLAATSERAAAVLRVLDATTALVEPRYYDDHAVLRAATDAVASAAPAVRPAAVVVHLPEQLDAASQALVRALGAAAETRVLLGVVPDLDAQQPAHDLALALGAGGAPASESPSVTASPITAERLVRGTSADVEVLLALRAVLDACDAGTRLDRIAVLFATESPYARLLHEELVRNEIPYHSPGVRTLSTTVAGRTLLGALGLADRGWRRDEVIAWLSGAPLHHAGGAVPAAAWDRLSRAAGVVGGADDWAAKLAALRDTELASRAAALDEGDEARAEGFARNAAACQALADFVAGLVHRLDPDHAPTTWHAFAAWTRSLLVHLLGDASVRQRWHASDEIEAAQTVLEVIEQLRPLDAVEPAPTAGAFLSALRTELDRAAPTTTRTGVGLLIGPIHHAVGLDLDLVVVLGMTDSALPGRHVEHALLPDDERAAADPTLPLHGGTSEGLHRAFLAAVAAAPRRILSYPKGDLRSGRELRPSRWWLEALAATRGLTHTLYAGDVDDLPPGDDVLDVPSFTAAVLGDGAAIGLADHDLRVVARHRLIDRLRVDDHWLVFAEPALRRAFSMRAERRAIGFSRFDGAVGPLQRPPRALSATALQQYASCPRRYLLGQHLRVQEPVEPERILRLDPRSQGTLVHTVLERFLRQQTELPPIERVRPSQPWTDADHARLDELLDAAAAEFEALGVTGHPVLWATDLRVIRRDLHGLLDADSAYRARCGATPEAVEQRIGLDGDEPLRVEVDGRVLEFRGVIDRIDRTDDGGLVVLDYKYSKGTGYADLANDPVVRGTLLQPVLYGRMARRQLGDHATRIDAGFWLAKGATRFAQHLVPVDAEAEARFDDVVGVLVAGITAGSFPARPGEQTSHGSKGKQWESCAYCAFTSVCADNRDAAWLRVRSDDRIAPYRALAEPSNAPREAPEAGT